MLNKFRIPNRIAAPGYSNHQGGIAIDFSQDRVPGHEIGISYDRQGRWRSSWFFQWLQNNAASFGFQQYTNEVWHWEYKPGSKGQFSNRSREAEYPSRNRPTAPPPVTGITHTFRLKSLPYDVAVYYPKEADLKEEVEVLVFAHGILTVCSPYPKGVEDLVKGAPFNLGRSVDSSKRGTVLVVPYLNWKKGNHPLAEPANLNALVAEALEEVGTIRGTKKKPILGNLILAGHSRAYGFLEPLAKSSTHPQMQQEALGKLTEVWPLDITYTFGGSEMCDVGNWKRWLEKNQGLKVKLYFIDGSGTAFTGRKFAKLAGDRLKVTPIKLKRGETIGQVHCALPSRLLPELLSQPAASGNPELEEELEELLPLW